MHIHYSVATPAGDLRVSGDDLRSPLEGCELRTSYGQYFSAIEAALRADAGRMTRIAAAFLGRGDAPEAVHVRAEKHGALYHPASLEASWADGTAARFALLVAVTQQGRAALRREAAILDQLRIAFDHGLVPTCLHCLDRDETTFVLAPWFCGFHEFHVDRSGGFALWDHDLGVRPIPEDRAGDVFFQAARILTLYLDAQDGSCIRPWSHAAGDFIVAMNGQGVQVRLSTVRGYASFDEDNPLAALFTFFLDLALRIRLDRVDGTGQWVWLEAKVLERAVQGVYAAVSEREAEDTPLGALRRVLPAFSSRELLEQHEPVLESFSRRELETILPRLDGHCAELAACLAGVRERPEQGGTSA